MFGRRKKPPTESELNDLAAASVEAFAASVEDLRDLVDRGDRRAVPALLRALEQSAVAWETKDDSQEKRPGETQLEHIARVTAPLRAMSMHQWVVLMIAKVPRQCFIPALERIVAVIPDPNTLDVLAMCRLAEPRADEPPLGDTRPAIPVPDIPSSESLADPGVLNDPMRASRLASGAPIQQLFQALVVAREVGHNAVEIVQRE